jgi:hypothetical protein
MGASILRRTFLHPSAIPADTLAVRLPHAGPGVLLLYGLTIFLSAFLLFLIQPMFARMALPLLGGSPGVWNTALVFYQAALLAGYSYAHWSTSRLGVSRQRWLHILMLGAALIALPIHVAQGWTPPSTGNPAGWLLLLLAASVGFPFFAVSTSSPVLQRWFAATGHPAARDPYFLYAASNAGSLLALLAYPALVEPFFRLRDQAALWSGGYAVLLVLFACCAVAGKPLPRITHDLHADIPAKESVRLTRRLRWMFLAAVPASGMTGVTTYLSSDIAAIPLLWVIPLALYLLTFIFAFAARPMLPERLMARAFPLLVSPRLAANRRAGRAAFDRVLLRGGVLSYPLGGGPALGRESHPVLSLALVGRRAGWGL